MSQTQAEKAPSWTSLPGSLPVPEDDGACNHLPNTTFPNISLPSTSGTSITPSKLPGLTILFCYPRTAGPSETVPDSWNAIPGARGCTPQACSFRDRLPELMTAGVEQVFGVSTQSTEYHLELKQRVGLPYELLSDERLELTRALELPTFDFEGSKLIKRLTMAVEEGKVVKVWYPVFPSDRSPGDVLEWMNTRSR